MTEIELFPALDRLGQPIPGHWDVYLDGKLLVAATISPFEATRTKLAVSGVFTNGISIKPKVQRSARPALASKMLDPRAGHHPNPEE